MAIEFRCTGCRKLLRSDDDAAGKQAKCPECGAVAVVPNAPGSAPESSQYPSVRPVNASPFAQGAPVAPPRKPGKVVAVAIMLIVGGGIAAALAITDLLMAFGLCFTAILAPYEIVLAILAIIKGVRLLGATAHCELPPKGIAVMQIVNIINCDVTNMVLGIVTLAFCGDPEVKAYLRGY
jgi:hypothetical protein